MRNRIVSCIVAILFLLLISCPSPQIEISAGGEASTQTVSSTEARLFAQAYVHAFVRNASVDSIGSWSSSSSCKEVFPVYNEGFEDISYYECKITTGETDAGYILVNVNGTDLPITEFSTSGCTYTERLRKLLGRTDFFVYRYGFKGLRALEAPLPVDTSNITSKSISPSLAEIGVADLSSSYGKWGVLSREHGCVPYYTRKSLDANRSASIVAGASRASETNPSIEFYELNGKWYDDVTRSWYSTAPWSQTSFFGRELPYSALSATNPGGKYPIGCGPTAWSIVYAYWQRFKGASTLFSGVNFNDSYSWNYGWMYDQTVKSVELELAADMKSWWGPGYGATFYLDMPNGVQLAKRKGYASSTCNWVMTQPLQWVIYNTVRDAVKSDRPAIIAIGADGSAGTPTDSIISNHYVVVEKVRKGNYRDSFDMFGSIWWWWAWADATAEMYVNMGWGSTSYYRWITTIDTNPYWSPSGTFTSPSYAYDGVFQ